MRGDLRHSSLADVMRHLYAERKSGTLHLSREGIERRVHFKKGVAIFAESDDQPPGSREEAERLLQSLFSWTSGELSFVEGEPTVDDLRALTASPSVVILEGSRRIDDRQTLEHLVGGPASVFACTESSVLPLFTMKLSPEESAILKFARERERFASRELPFASDDLTVVRALNALVAVGLLEIAEKEAAATPDPEPEPEPEPQPAPAVPLPVPEPARAEPPPIPVEVESLLATFEARRSAAAPPSPSTIPSPDPDPDPRSMKAAIPDPTPPPKLDPRVEPAPRPELRNVSKPPPSPGSIRSPKRNIGTIAVAALSVAVAGTGLGIWFFTRGHERPRPTLAADSPSPEAEPVVSKSLNPPNAPEAEDESHPDVEPPPSDAELFYSANLAFENGDFERSKAELTSLLERQPDFPPARELMARIDRALSAKQRAAEPRKPPAKVVAKAPEPEPIAEPVPPPAPAPPDPTTLLGDARAALDGGDLEIAQRKLDELEQRAPSYPGADELRDELQERSWERKLPLALKVRHDHALGGCNGVLTLTSTGYTYHSKEHEWVWSFAEVAETERRSADRLRIETRAHASFNFELKQSLSDEDWKRHLALGKR